jgi:hypothetical protein
METCCIWCLHKCFQLSYRPCYMCYPLFAPLTVAVFCFCRGGTTWKANEAKKAKVGLGFNCCCDHAWHCSLSMVLPSNRKRIIFHRPFSESWRWWCSQLMGGQSSSNHDALSWKIRIKGPYTSWILDTVSCFCQLIYLHSRGCIVDSSTKIISLCALCYQYGSW